MFVLLASPYRQYLISRDEPLLQSFFTYRGDSPIVYLPDPILQQWPAFLTLREWMKLPNEVFESDELYKEMRGDVMLGKVQEYEDSLKSLKYTKEEIASYSEKYTATLRSNPFSYEGTPSSLLVPKSTVSLSEVSCIATTLMLPKRWMLFVTVDGRSSLHERRNFYRELGMMLRTQSIGRFPYHVHLKYFSKDTLSIHKNLGAWSDPAYGGAGLFFESHEMVVRTQWLSVARGILHSSLLLLLSEGRWHENRGEVPFDVVSWDDVVAFVNHNWESQTPLHATGDVPGWARYLAGLSPNLTCLTPSMSADDVMKLRVRSVRVLYKATGSKKKVRPLAESELKKIEESRIVPLNKVLRYLFHHKASESQRELLSKLLNE